MLKEGNSKTSCVVEDQFGERNGIEMITVNEWQESFTQRSIKLAELVLKADNSPEKSIEWAKRVLNI